MKKLMLAVVALGVGGLPVSVRSAAATPDGKALYDSRCALCHAKDGTGRKADGTWLAIADLMKLSKARGGPGEDTLDIVKKSTMDRGDAALLDVTLKGQGKMKPVKVSAEEAGAILEYQKTLPPKARD